MFKADCKCCVCGERGDQIHHLDGNSDNNIIDNLAFLCFKDHDWASQKGGLRKKLSKEVIVKYRELHYQVIENRRKKELGVIDNSIPELTEEKLLVATKTALIILELEKIKEKYLEEDWNERSDILSALNKYANHSSYRLAYDILDFLLMASGQTRLGMTEKVASNVLTIVLNFFPSFNKKRDQKGIIELGEICIEIGENMAYDSFIHLRKINIAMYGLTIIKFIYRQAKKNKISVLQKEIERVYDKLESQLNRPNRTDLEDAQEVLQTFRDDLDVWDLAFPLMRDRLMKRLDSES
jgi:hypothetical protein